MLRIGFFAVAVCCFAAAALMEVAGAVRAQVASTPLLVIATVPPAATPLPRLVLPGEVFKEAPPSDGATITGVPGSTTIATAGSATGGSPLASYGIVTVSVDGDNSYALISTPHGIDMKRLQEVEDGYRIVSITDRGVTFQGGIFIPVGFSQASNPSVPPVGGSLPNTTVPVNINASSAAQGANPTATPAIRAPINPATAAPQTVRTVNGLQSLPSPATVNSLQSLPGPQYANPITATASPAP